jgi:glycosyltransferase involved in cell wall biosynthesis
MNIGYFNAQGFNGIEYWFQLEQDELRRRGHNVRTFYLKGPQPTKEDIEWMDFAHFHFAHVADRYKRLGVPFCVSPHTNDIFPDSGKRLKKVSNHPKCKFVTYQSQYHLKHFFEWGIKPPLVHLPMCCRTELFTREKSKGDRMICGGRLIPRKGLDRIMHLGNLIVFGDGPLENELKAMNSTNTFYGRVDGKELKELFEKSYVYLFPNRIVNDGNRDGIPNTVKEALLMELYVISSPVAGLPEVDTVILNEDWSKEGIQRILDTISIEPNKKGRQHILDNFSPKVCIDKLEKAIGEYL